MEVLLEKYPYRYVEAGIIELNGEPDYRIQKYNTYTMRYRDEVTAYAKNERTTD